MDTVTSATPSTFSQATCRHTSYSGGLAGVCEGCSTVSAGGGGRKYVISVKATRMILSLGCCPLCAGQNDLLSVGDAMLTAGDEVHNACDAVLGPHALRGAADCVALKAGDVVVPCDNNADACVRRILSKARGGAWLAETAR